MVNIVDKYMLIGLNEGIKKGKLEDAGAFLKEGISIDIVTRCTGLPLETVQQIAASL